MRAEVLSVVNIKSTVFWYVTPYSLLDRLDTVCCLQLQVLRLERLTFCLSHKELTKMTVKPYAFLLSGTAVYQTFISAYLQKDH
jgi:hypothetical protein